MTTPHTRDAAESRLTRRTLVARGAQLLGGAGMLGGLLAACGGDSDSAAPAAPAPPATEPPATTAASPPAATTEPPGTTEAVALSGTLNFNTYPGWIGASEYDNFKELYPDVTIKEDTSGVGSVTAIAQKVQRDPDAFDFLLLGRAGCPQLEASGLLATLNYDNIPNIANVPDRFRQDYPWGIPTDYGKTGYSYRRDLIEETPTTWREFFDLSKKYSGKVILTGVLEDCIGNTLKMLGYSGSTQDPGELEEAKNALISIKPDVQAFLTTDLSKPVIEGTAVMGMDWDFSIALAQQTNPDIVWVLPEEGLVGYVEGWVAIATSDNLPAVEAFMNFHLDPINFADFINTTGSANLMPAAESLIKPEIRDNPILAFDENVLSLVEFGSYHDEAQELWNETWNEIQAA